MDKNRTTQCLFRSILGVVLLGLVLSPVYAASLTLVQAEKAALMQSPELKSFHARNHAIEADAIVADQFADPKLMLGTINVPVDSFNFDQESMTQIQVGLIQIFPHGHSLHYKSLKKQFLAHSEFEKGQLSTAQILLELRVSWLNLYYWQHAKWIVFSQKRIFRHLIEVTESMLANNKAQQKDVIRAQLELTNLDDELIDINQQIATSRAQVARWIGPALAKKAQPNRLPHWSRLPNLANLQIKIKHHPELGIDEAIISANHAEMKFAQEQYKPGFTVSAMYGFRQGDNFDGSKRSDFLTAQVSVDLPLFTHNRQDKVVKASQENMLASEQDKMSHYRQLNKLLSTQYATWQQQKKRVRLYQLKLIPESKHYAQATLTAYQNTLTDFPMLARAYDRELNSELGGLKSRVGQSIAHANLLYLQGK
jgi:outer membrane protein TolC